MYLTESVCLFVIVILSCTNCTIIYSEYKFIGDCTLISRGNSNDKLIFICYDHSHQDRFFTYDSSRKRCLNDANGYEKNWISEIAFQNCEIAKIAVDIFEYYRNIRVLNMSDIALTSLDKDNFNGNHGQKLQTLIASHNLLTSVKPNLFASAKHIKEVDFSCNKINFIDPLAFKDANEIEILDLSSNYLKDLPEQIFDDAKNLHALYLSKNRIVEIDPLALSKLHNLSKLDLSVNNLTSIYVQSIPLTYLNLSYNAIADSKLKDLTKLEILDFSHNNLITFN